MNHQDKLHDKYISSLRIQFGVKVQTEVTLLSVAGEKPGCLKMKQHWCRRD